MELEEKDIPIIVEKGFQIAADLLSPDSFYSIAVHQRDKKYSNFSWNEGKVSLTTPSGKINVNPDKITEQGVAICKSKTGGDLFFKDGGRKGIAMEITPNMCQPRGEYIGSLHTHPGGNPIPSVGDLGATTHNKDKIMCIATRTKANEVGVNCYIPKTEFLPEEIHDVDVRVREILTNMMDETLNIEFHPDKHQKELLSKMGIEMANQVAKVPVYDLQKTKWFSSTLLDEVRDFYDVKKFRRRLQ